MISRTLISRIGNSAGKKLASQRYQLGLRRAFAEVSSHDHIRINHWSQLNTYHYTELFNAIAFASNSERMSDVIDVGAAIMTDQLLAMGLKIMETNEFELSNGFYNKLLPFIKTYTKQFDRNHTQAFAETMVSMGNLGVKDKEYWEICRKKLLLEGYHDYIPLRNIGHLVKALAHVNQADPELLRALGSQIIKHRKVLDQENLNAAIVGFEISGLGAEVFRQSLEEGRQRGHNPPPKELH